MAGAGYKLFNTGDVLTAQQVNEYLMQQTVMVFANAAARTTALSGILAEGLVSYLKDTDVVEIYTGSAWVSLDDPNAIQNSLLTTTGDIIYASAANTPARRAIGSTGDVLTVSGGVPTWAAPSSAGGETSLASGSLPTNSGVLTLSSISGSYNHLRLELRSWDGGTGGGALLRFNGSSSAIYSRLWMSATSVSQTNAQTSIKSILDLGFANRLDIIEIYNYAGSSLKTVHWTTGADAASGNTVFLVGIFNSTSAITSISMDNSTNGYYTAGTYVLYGVK